MKRLTTDEQRELAVELLRCAADLVQTQRGAFVAAEQNLDLDISEVSSIAHQAWCLVTFERRGATGATVDDYDEWTHTQMLEAAQRLEEDGDVDSE